MGMTTTAKGQCLCGAVRFETKGALRGVSICHCKMCRRWHGHTGAYTNVPKTALSFTESRGLAWYHTSDLARRGFCRECGSCLFWEAFDRDSLSIAAGTLDDPTGLATTLQIYTEDKGDYYELDTRIPSRAKTADHKPRTR
jgi:hypothetical protein